MAFRWFDERGGSDKTIAATWKRLQVPGVLHFIVESGSDLPDAEVDASLKFNHRIVAPEAVTDFFPGHDLPGAFGKQQQHTERLRMDLHGSSGFAELTVRGIQLECPEAYH